MWTRGCAPILPSMTREPATPCSYHADRPAPERKWRMGREVPQGIRPGRKRPAHPGRERRLEEPPGGHHRLERQRECGDLAGGMGGLYQPGIGGRRSACPGDHRSYKRRGIDKIPLSTWGQRPARWRSAASAPTKGEVNRQIAADNKLLKEIKARITRLYNWSKAEAEKPEGQQPSMIGLVGGPAAAQAARHPHRQNPGFAGERRPVQLCRQTASRPCSSSMKKLPI